MKKIILTLMFVFLIFGVFASERWIIEQSTPIQKSVFASLSRAQMIDNLDETVDNAYISGENIYFFFSINSVEKYGEDYYMVRRGIKTELPVFYAIRCLNEYNEELCLANLVNGNETIDANYNGRDIVIEPIMYQYYQEVLNELEYLENLQDEINEQTSLLQLIGGSIIFPIIS